MNEKTCSNTSSGNEYTILHRRDKIKLKCFAGNEMLQSVNAGDRSGGYITSSGYEYTVFHHREKKTKND
ncbi:hypothetical protein Hanom_Chr10g00887541 [Helianthus anomalus]